MASTPRRLVVTSLLVATGAVALIVLWSQQSEHQLRAMFVSALQVVPGQQVRIAGRNVGSVDSVTLDGGLAVVGMDIDSGSWPLRQGTTAQLRFGSAAGYAARFVQLQPGPASAPSLPQDGVLPLAQTTTPVEFDQVFDTFSAPTRANLAGLLQRGAALFSGHTRDLAGALDHGGALESLAEVEHDLGQDPYALSAFVTNAAGAVHQLESRQRQLGPLVDAAATTFSALAANAQAQQQSLAALPGTLVASRHTLAHLESSLGGLSALVADLQPGAVTLRRVAPVLDRTLVTLRRVAPQATATLDIGTTELPRLSTFLARGTTFVPGLTRALRSLDPMLGCIRPYTPEIGGFISGWDAMAAGYDGLGHYANVLVQAAPFAPGTQSDSAQLAAASGGALHYAMPRPPGLNVGQPWFQPQCGAGPSSLNPNDDPENPK